MSRGKSNCQRLSVTERTATPHSSHRELATRVIRRILFRPRPTPISHLLDPRPVRFCTHDAIQSSPLPSGTEQSARTRAALCSRCSTQRIVTSSPFALCIYFWSMVCVCFLLGPGWQASLKAAPAACFEASPSRHWDEVLDTDQRAFLAAALADNMASIVVR
ncbi:hypothetical protein BD289DRAFT_431097 [Coniella lustricola]|uniref:Uncharacterized protein n=1 Tax=Coniella lustricola TaxID=2025994 RepID=A0A2T3ABC4_9PEZI|nr:hypothetical protein BD289DRAFT_431097 [Coniella lustricola]